MAGGDREEDTREAIRRLREAERELPGYTDSDHPSEVTNPFLGTLKVSMPRHVRVYLGVCIGILVLAAAAATLIGAFK